MDEIRYAETGAGQVAYAVVGGDGPPLVYASGLMIPIEVMQDDPVHARLLRGLCRLGTLIVFDRRGIGASDQPDWTQPLALQWANDLIAVLDAEGLESADVLGFEAGAAVAVAAAQGHPGRIAKLVLFHIPPVDGDALAEVGARWLGRMEAAVARDQNEVDATISTTMPSRADDPAFPGWLERAGRLGASPATAGRIWSALFEHPLADLGIDPRDVDVPTLVVQRAASDVVPPASSKALAESMPGGRYVELPGADFIPFAGDIDALLAEIAEFTTGERRAPAPDRPLVAILFTDIVDSTGHAVAAGDARWRDLLDRHDDVVRATLERNHGTLVKNTGDGALATFATGTRALDGVSGLRSAVAAVGLDIRAGIHVGEVERRGSDITGIGVNLAARIMDRAGPGEVVVSASVPVSTLGGGHDFESLGPHELRGLQGEWELFRLAL